jgi:hypothetical protein
MKYNLKDVEKYVPTKRNFVGMKVNELKARYLYLFGRVNRGAESLSELDEFLSVEAVLEGIGLEDWLKDVKK